MRNTKIYIFIGKRLFSGRLPGNKSLFSGSLPGNKSLFSGSLPENRRLFSGRLPENKSLFSGRLLGNKGLLVWESVQFWYSFGPSGLFNPQPPKNRVLGISKKKIHSWILGSKAR